MLRSRAPSQNLRSRFDKSKYVHECNLTILRSNCASRQPPVNITNFPDRSVLLIWFWENDLTAARDQLPFISETFLEIRKGSELRDVRPSNFTRLKIQA